MTYSCYSGVLLLIVSYYNAIYAQFFQSITLSRNILKEPYILITSFLITKDPITTSKYHLDNGTSIMCCTRARLFQIDFSLLYAQSLGYRDVYE